MLSNLACTLKIAKPTFNIKLLNRN